MMAHVHLALCLCVSLHLAGAAGPCNDGARAPCIVFVCAPCIVFVCVTAAVAAAAAADLIGEVPVQQVAERYKVTKGQVQGLQDRAGVCL
jgi:hypothetical protein